MNKYPTKFTTPYDQYKDKEGQRCRIVRVYATPTKDIDAECLPMFLVEFENGDRIHAWPEEVGR